MKVWEYLNPDMNIFIVIFKSQISPDFEMVLKRDMSGFTAGTEGSVCCSGALEGSLVDIFSRFMRHFSSVRL